MSRKICSDSSEGRVGAHRTEVAAVLRHLFGALAVDIGLAGLDQVFGHLVQLAKIVAGVVQVFLATLLPAEPQPLDAVHDRIDVFLVFLFRIGVVETQMAAAVVVARQAEVHADRLGVTHVQVAVWFWWETGDH
jgi:hypothetical protein